MIIVLEPKKIFFPFFIFYIYAKALSMLRLYPSRGLILSIVFFSEAIRPRELLTNKIHYIFHRQLHIYWLPKDSIVLQ